MATYDLDEQERLDQLKAWWKRWGNLALFALAVVIAAAAGWRYWQHHTHTQRLEAAAAFERLGQAVETGDAKAAREAATLLIDKYAATAFAPRAALVLAKLDHDAADYKAAEARLDWAQSHSKEPAVRDLARLRLAGVQFDAGRLDEALKTLSGKHSEAFAPRFADLRGDILLAQGKEDDARAAYLAAFKAMKEDNPYRSVVELKLDAVGGAEDS